MGDNLGDTKIRGTEKPVLSLFFACNLTRGRFFCQVLPSSLKTVTTKIKVK